MAKSPSPPDRPPLEGLATVAELVESPGLARIYAFALESGPATVPEMVDELDVPQTTAYEHVEALAGAGLLQEVREQRTRTYDGVPISLTLSSDGESRTITPALVAAVARRTSDDDLDRFVERHGLDGLARALERAAEYVDGTVNYRIAARELDVSPLEAEVVLQALEPIAAEYATAAE